MHTTTHSTLPIRIPGAWGAGPGADDQTGAARPYPAQPAGRRRLRDSWSPHLSVDDSLVAAPLTAVVARPGPAWPRSTARRGRSNRCCSWTWGVRWDGASLAAGRGSAAFQDCTIAGLLARPGPGRGDHAPAPGWRSAAAGRRGENCSFLFKSLPEEGFDLTKPAHVGEMSLRIEGSGGADGVHR